MAKFKHLKVTAEFELMVSEHLLVDDQIGFGKAANAQGLAIQFGEQLRYMSEATRGACALSLPIVSVTEVVNG